MRIPPDALIRAEKLTSYLLLPKKSNDKSKYLARGGFDLSNPQALEDEIRRLTAQTEATIERANEYGVYYNVIDSLIGPAGVKLPVTLVWIERLDGVYSFVTLIPAE